MVRALEDDADAVRRGAVLSLIELLTVGDDELRHTVREQFQRADPPELVSQLVEIGTESARPAVWTDVAWLLGYVADPDDDAFEPVVETLLSGLDDEARVSDRAAESLVRLGADAVGSRLQIFVRDGSASETAIERAHAVLDELGVGENSEAVSNAVEYTYVREPADYTDTHADSR